MEALTLILIASVLNMFIGFLWYGPFFGKSWMMMENLTEESMKGVSKSQMAKMYFLSFVSGLVLVSINYYIYQVFYISPKFLISSLLSSVTVSAGITLAATFPNYIFLNKSLKLWLINYMYPVVVSLVSYLLYFSFGGGFFN